MWDLSLRRQPLSSCGTQAPERVGSVVAVRGLSCPVACGILVLRRGMEPASPALEGGWMTGEVPASVFYVLVFWPRSMWDLSSLIRERTHTLCIGR